MLVENASYIAGQSMEDNSTNDHNSLEIDLSTSDAMFCLMYVHETTTVLLQ